MQGRCDHDDALAREELAQALAVAFCRELRGELGPERLAEVNRRNREDCDPNICHSHDFTDANQVMLDAAARAGIDISRPSDEAQAALVNRAWTLAKESGFSL